MQADPLVIASFISGMVTGAAAAVWCVTYWLGKASKRRYRRNRYPYWQCRTDDSGAYPSE